MSTPHEKVPFVLRVATRLLPRDARQDVLGDLLEVWRERVRSRPWPARTMWLTRQLLAVARARLDRAPGWGWRGPRGAETSYAPSGGGRPLAGLRRRPAIGFSWLDVKLGIRMLGKQPILTVVAGTTLALGIPASLLPTHVARSFDTSSFPVEEADRIVGLRNWSLVTGRPLYHPLHDLSVWRDRLRSFEVIGAARSDPWNVHSPDGRAAEVRGAEVTASVFEMLRVPPLIGRTLIHADEAEGAPDVVVLSEDVWGSRFAGDPEIVGKVIGIGRRPHTVVGVMPSGFQFPWLDDLWLPLRADPDDYSVGQGPDLMVFGRLADGTSRQGAEVELATVGARLAAEWPETHQTVRPEVVSPATLAFGTPAAGIVTERWMLFLQLFSFSLLVIVCGNVGTLILARTATRISEIAVRTALGASRFRILSQLFVESLVLSVGATAAGLLLTQAVVDRSASILLDAENPYWLDLGIGGESVVFALCLAALAAVIAGVLPALKATSPDVQQNLQRNASGATVRFGAMTTVLVVTEVAISVGFLALGAAAMKSFVLDRSGEPDMAAERYLVASLRTPWFEPTEDETDGYEEEFRARVTANHEALRDRLAADGWVRRVGMGNHVPGISYNDRALVFRGDEDRDGAGSANAVRGLVHFDYFRDLGLEVLAGRAFNSSDVEGDPARHRPAVVVNQQFVDDVLDGGDAIGREMRYAVGNGEDPGQWYEIVGVVETFGTNLGNPERSAAFYHPLGSADHHPMRYLIEVAENPLTFLPRLRSIAADIDPDAMIQSPYTLSELVEESRLQDSIISLFVFILSGMGMVLAATGLYALMSFTVAQRTREIGIRTALGAGARAVVATIARRAAVQLAIGVALGTVLGWWIVSQVADQSEFSVDSVPLLLAGVGTGVMVFSALACLSPTLRGLRIEPTEALRES